MRHRSNISVGQPYAWNGRFLKSSPAALGTEYSFAGVGSSPSGGVATQHRQAIRALRAASAINRVLLPLFFIPDYGNV